MKQDVITVALLLVVGGAELSAQDLSGNSNTLDVTSMGLEELANLQISTASRTPGKAFTTPAAVTVVTGEEIHRSGATSVAEALRMVPGLNVAQLNSANWAITARGFNDSFANKLLVLVDGRTVYAPLFSGVYWDAQNLMLENIDRIEVIKGPGASLWGANAVNGVINIITKPAAATQGGLISGGGGTHYLGVGESRYGAKLGNNGFWRGYAKYDNRDHFKNSAGLALSDGGAMLSGGLRADWNLSSLHDFTLQGDLFKGEAGDSFDGKMAGGNLLGRWTRFFSEDSELILQTYYDRTERESPILTEYRNTFDIDAQHRFALGEQQSVLWGLAYRLTADQTFGSALTSFLPSASTDHLRSAFMQDDITLAPDRLHLILGSKFEINDYSGLEIQPSARLSWLPDDQQTVWASVARAARSPSRAEASLVSMGTPPASLGLPAGTVVLFQGNAALNSEDLIAYELGYRVRPTPTVTLDATAFYNDYHRLRSGVVGAPLSLAPLVIPITAANSMAGTTYGGEFSAVWQATPEWRLHAGYALLQMHLRHPLGVGDSSLEPAAGDSPQQQAFVRSYLDLPGHLQLDTSLYYVDRLPAQGVASYLRWDVRLGWRPRKNLEFSLAAQNLLDNHHPEFGSNFLVTPSEIERSVQATVTWRF